MGIINVTDPHGAMLDSMRKAFGSPADYPHGSDKWCALLGLYAFLDRAGTASASDAVPSEDAYFAQIGRSIEVVASFAALDVQLPISADPDNFGVVQDAQGREFATIDVNAERPEEQVDAIVSCLVTLINACAGLPAEKVTPEPDHEPDAPHGMEPILTEHRAWAILQELKALTSGTANEPLLRDRLEAYALGCGRKKFRSAVALLANRGFVQVEEDGPVRVVAITEAGADHPNRIWQIRRAAA